MAHVGPEKAPQTRPGGLFPKMLVFEVARGQRSNLVYFEPDFVFILHVTWL